jgi:hypoxanthine phosphoribosyltransferase
LVRAIAQCALKSPVSFDYDSGATLQAACSVIETDPKLAELRTALVATIKTSFYCHACQKMTDALHIEGQQIFMFKLNLKKN